MVELFYFPAVLLLSIGLSVFASVDRVYRELGRITTGRVRDNLDLFEAEIEPRLGMDRRRGAMTFSLLSRLGLVAVAATTTYGVILFASGRVAAVLQIIIYLTAEVLIAMHFVPDFLVARTSIRGLVPFVPVLRIFVTLVWPLRALLELGISLAHISEEIDPGAPVDRRAEQEGIEALVEAAQEEGILEQDEADLIEQVVEFGDKRVRELMTPRPTIVAISAGSSLEQLRSLFIESRYSRIPVYEQSLDDVFGVVHARDLLLAPQSEAPERSIRELARPILVVPETKPGSTLLKEMQQKHQHLAIVVDEYGSVAGLVTLEDLVEEIVGEIGEEHRQAAPDVVRESDGSLVLRGSVAMERLQELLGLRVDSSAAEASTTVAGLLNTLAGHVPAAGEKIEYDGVRFEVLEANQRKVLRLRARRHTSAAVLRT